jgi:hypothetical protein
VSLSYTTPNPTHENARAYVKGKKSTTKNISYFHTKRYKKRESYKRVE